MMISSNYGPQCYTNEAHVNRAFLESANSMTFTHKDMKVAYPDHKRSLYLEACNDVHIRKALVDMGSSVNVITLAILTVARIPQKRVTKMEIQISCFGNSTETSIGCIMLDLRVGPIHTQTRFHVLDIDVRYDVLLGRPWLNKHKLICSTYHQCVKKAVRNQSYLHTRKPSSF